MSHRLRSALAGIVGVVAIVGATPAETAAASSGCGGVVFHDLDADGNRTESPNPPARYQETGISDVHVSISDADDDTIRTTTDGSGDWHVELEPSQFPIRIEFSPPTGYEPGRRGADGGAVVQYVQTPGGCNADSLGNLGLFDRNEYCAEQPDLAVACHVPDGAATDDVPAIHLVSSGAADNAATDAEAIDDWLDPAPETLATVGDIGTVYGLASDRTGVTYAAGFTKRHTRATSRLNQTGNPTTIYRIEPGRRPTVLTVVDPDAPNPHLDTNGRRDPHDLAVMDDVFTTGLGDLEVTADGSTLFTVDLGNRDLVEIDAAAGLVSRRIPLDGRTLSFGACGESPTNPAGDIRPFGLGWSADDTLLVGVVCSAESTVDTGEFVDESGDPGSGAGNHARLRAYVYELDGHALNLRLTWPLAGDRGETQGNGLLSNEARWHPWTPNYPFDDEHDAVSYPQPVISDISTGAGGDLVIALADRWGHQTAPETEAPGRDGRTRVVSESVSAGDLQRACRTPQGWSIEGRSGCAGGIGNGWEFFDGDSYGWHAETALGSVVRLPGRAEIVATHIDPIPDDDTWQSGGVAWHDAVSGDYRRGARLYDGRHADDDGTFEHASGVGDLAAFCGGPPLQVGGRIWHDLDGDGRHDADEEVVPWAHVELWHPSRETVLGVAATDQNGMYTFDETNVASGLEAGSNYRVVLAPTNQQTGGVLAGAGPFSGLTPSAGTLDVVAGDDPSTTEREPSVGLTNDIGLRDRYDLAVDVSLGDRSYEAGLVSFVITIRNEGSVRSGQVDVRTLLPVETSLIPLTEPGAPTPSFSDETVTWSYSDAQSIPPGAARSFEMTLQVNDPTVASITNDVAIVADSGNDADSQIGMNNGQDDTDSLTIELFALAGSIWAEEAFDASGETIDPIRSPISGTVVQLIGDDERRLASTTTDADGRFLFTSLPGESYRIAIPASEFDSAGRLDGFDHGFDQAIGAERRDVGAMVDDGAVTSQPFVLGFDTELELNGMLASVELGLRQRPAKPTIDRLVPALMWPTVGFCVGALVLMRRRRFARD